MPALFGLAILVSVLLPLGFFLAGPVRERRAMLGVTYTTVVVVGWCGALTLAIFSPGAAAGAAALLSGLALVAGLYSWRDEKLLAELDAALDVPERRRAALERLRERLLDMGTHSRAVVALMEVAGFPARRLIARGCYREARELLDFLEAELGAHMGRVDLSELRLLQTRVELQLGDRDRASERLDDERRAGTSYPADADVLTALLEATRGEASEADSRVGFARRTLVSEWSRSLAELVEAHVAAARGDDDQALRRLHGLGPSYRACLLELARVLPGPASELASRVDGANAPYR